MVGVEASIIRSCKSGGEIYLRAAQKRPPTRLGQLVDSSLDGDEPAIDVSTKDIISVGDRRLEVPRTSRSFCQRGGAGESALAICCHDRRPQSPTFGGIAPPAAVLLDETDRRRVFLRGIGAVGLTRTSTSPFGNTRASRNRAFYKGCETWRRSHAPSRATRGERPAKLRR
jgi:hypothetical protein